MARGSGSARGARAPRPDRLATLLPFSAKAQKHLRNLAEPLERRYLGLNHFDPALKRRIYAPAFREELADRDARESMRKLYDGAGGPEVVSRMAAFDCRRTDSTGSRVEAQALAMSRCAGA